MQDDVHSTVYIKCLGSVPILTPHMSMVGLSDRCVCVYSKPATIHTYCTASRCGNLTVCVWRFLSVLMLTFGWTLLRHSFLACMSSVFVVLPAVITVVDYSSPWMLFLLFFPRVRQLRSHFTVAPSSFSLLLAIRLLEGECGVKKMSMMTFFLLLWNSICDVHPHTGFHLYNFLPSLMPN